MLLELGCGESFKGLSNWKVKERDHELRICSRRRLLPYEEHLREVLPKQRKPVPFVITELEAESEDTHYNQEEGLPDTSSLQPLELKGNLWSLAVSPVRLKASLDILPSDAVEL